MIFCKSRKFIFLRVPKNASSSLSLQILKNIELQPGDFFTAFNFIPPYGFGGFQFNRNIEVFKTDEHAPLYRLMGLGIIDPKEIESYSIYGVLRNPVDRFFSLFTYLIHLNRNHLSLEVEKMTKEEIASVGFDLLNESKRKGMTYHYIKDTRKDDDFPMFPQTEWLVHEGKLINNIVVHPNFDDMLIKLTGSKELQFREKTGKKPIDCPISKSTMEGIRYWYAEDFDLWEKFGYNK